MQNECETVKVQADCEGGYMIINKSDLTKEHTLFGEKKAPKKKANKKAE